MSLAALSTAIRASPRTLLSTDLFNTVLLRDRTTETQRLAEAGRCAGSLLGVRPEVLARLRWTSHDSAYRAVGLRRPDGEATLEGMCRTMAMALGRGEETAGLLRRVEVDTDVRHLRPNRPLVDLLERARTAGTRVVAVSDTYYSGEDLRRMLTAVVGHVPVDAVYSSADLGRTKHAGGIFALVAKREGVPPGRILHVGDSWAVDVVQAQAASWTATHLPRGARYGATALAGRMLGLPSRMQRQR